MSKPEVDEIEIAGATLAIRQKYDSVIGENQARNIAYTALVGARAAKFKNERKGGGPVHSPSGWPGSDQ